MKRDLITVIVGRAIQMAVLLLMLRAMTARLSPAEVGNFSLLVTIETLFVWVFISPVGLFVNRHTLEWRARHTLWINYATQTVYVVAVALLTAILLAVWQYIFKPVWAQQFSWLSISIGVYIVFHVLNLTIIPNINILGKRLAFSILFVASQIFCLVFSWCFTGGRPTGEYWFFGQGAGFALGVLIALPFFIRATAPGAALSPPHFSARTGLNAVIAFCWPITITCGLNWVLFQSYRVVIGDLVSLDFLGLLFVGYTTSASVMAAVEVTASQFFSPYFYKHVEDAPLDQKYEAWAAYMSALYPLMIVIIVVLVAMSGPIAHILLAKKYAGAGIYVAVGAIVEGIRVMANTYALAAQVNKKTNSLLIPYIVGAASNITMLAGGTWLFGEHAAAPAMVLSAIIFLAAIHWAMVRHARTKISLLGTRWVVASLVALAGVSLAASVWPLRGAVSDLALLTLGGLVIVGAFFLLARDTLKVLEKFAR